MKLDFDFSVETIDLFESMYPIIFMVSKISSFVINFDLLDLIYAKHLIEHDYILFLLSSSKKLFTKF